jgi:AbrB family looped-hinge helix DNA binding protein
VKSTVSSEGQITLPAAIRRKLWLDSGTRVQLEIREGAVVVRKGGTPLHRVDQVFGRVKLARPVDALLDEMRGPRSDRGFYAWTTRVRLIDPGRD